MLKLKIAYAYETLKGTTVLEAIKTMVKTDFDSEATPTMLWLNKIPLTGLPHLKTDYAAHKELLKTASAVTEATAQIALTADLKVANVPYGYLDTDDTKAKVLVTMKTKLATAVNKAKFALGMSLNTYHTNYKPETKRITYTATQVQAYRADTKNKFSENIALLKAEGKLQVTKSEKADDAAVSQVEQDALWYYARNQDAKTSIKTAHDAKVTAAMTFTTKNTERQVYGLALAKAIASGMYTLANTADTTIDAGKLLSTGTFAAKDVIPFKLEYMVNYNFYNKQDLYVAYFQIKNTSTDVADLAKSKTFFKAMRDPTSTDGKLIRFGTEAFTGHKQMNHTTKASEITAAGAKFDAVWPDLGAFFAAADTAAYDISDLGYLGNMADRVVAQHGLWANSQTACDKTCLDSTAQPFTAIKTLETHAGVTTVRGWIAAKVVAEYKKQKAQFGQDNDTDLVSSGAYNLFGYLTSQWKIVDWNTAKVTAIMKSARKKVTLNPIYKNDIDTSKLKKADLTTAFPKADWTSAVGYTNAELWFLHYVTDTAANLDDYKEATTGFFTSDAHDSGDFDEAVGTEFPSYYFTNVKVNTKAWTRELINDVMFAANSFKALNSDQSANAVYKNMSHGQTYLAQPFAAAKKQYDNVHHSFKLAEDYCFQTRH